MANGDRDEEDERLRRTNQTQEHGFLLTNIY